jgi:hypothetical protein
MAAEGDVQVEEARTQSLFREVNERMEEIGRDARLVDGELLCECANAECVEPIPLTRAEYEAVRRIPTHFLIAPGHDVPAIERVVEANERHVVVEKFGVAGATAVRLDPRKRLSESS